MTTWRGAAGLLAVLAGLLASGPQAGVPVPASPQAVRAAAPPPAAAMSADATILAGAASRLITPEVGGAAAPVTLAGFSEGRLAEGVHDDLCARALVFEAGDAAAAIVVLDLYGLGRVDVQRVRDAIRVRAPAAARGGVLVACTRTHYAPDATGQFTAPGASVDAAWLGRVARAAAEAVEEAWRLRQPARLSFASTRLPRLLTDTRPPQRIDDQALLLRVETAAGKIGIAALAAWSGSPETQGRGLRRISADYPGDARRALEDAFGGVGIVLVGASGGHMLPVAPPVDRPAADGTAAVAVQPSPDAPIGVTLARALVVAWARRHDSVDPAPPDATRVSISVRTRAVDIPLDNEALRGAVLTGRRRAGLAAVGGLASEVSVLGLAAGGAPLMDLACVPGEIYPELVDGGIQEPQDPAADRAGEPAERPLRSLLRAPVRFVAGTCGDDLGDIIPASEWDEKPPFAYGLSSAPRGEETSPGPRTAPLLLRAFADMLQ